MNCHGKLNSFKTLRKNEWVSGGIILYQHPLRNLLECINKVASKPLRNSTQHLMRLFDCTRSERKQETTQTTKNIAQ